MGLSYTETAYDGCSGHPDLLATIDYMEWGIPGPRVILKSIRAMLAMKNTLAAYKNFYIRLGIQEYFAMLPRSIVQRLYEKLKKQPGISLLAP